MISVTTSTTGPTVTQVRSALEGARWNSLMRDIGLDLVQSVRKQFRVRGDPAGSWPALSGYRRPSRSRANMQTLGALRDAGATELVGKKRLRELNQGSPHSGYARRKHEGKTPGRGRYGPGVKLRDTGALIESTNAKVTNANGNTTISLVFDGTAPGRSISNEALADAHFNGRGNLPRRSPLDDMTKQWEEKSGQRIANWVQGVTGTWDP